MDGVLADTGPIHFESWVMLANQIGQKFTKKFFDQNFGRQSIPTIRELVGMKIDQQTVEQWAGKKEEYYRELVKDKIEPLPGVIRLIKELKERKFKLAVGSSGPLENVELILSSLRITAYFDAVISAADVKNGKPAPDVFLIAAKKVGISPENCVVIEDAPVGIEAAKKAGMTCIALRTTHCNVDLLEADLIVPDLSLITVNDILLLFEKKN